tara:strand:+ start:8916 stop:9170 length:255 start_codon:yes stop_codon:yes gene_type:complete
VQAASCTLSDGAISSETGGREGERDGVQEGRDFLLPKGGQSQRLLGPSSKRKVAMAAMAAMAATAAMSEGNGNITHALPALDAN